MAGHVPRKRFGQNFLRDATIVRALIQAIDPRPGQHLVEIGPGEGVLTERLIAACGTLDVIEIDRDLVSLLTRRFPAQSGLRIHQADALHFDFGALAEAGFRLRVVGNLPYNISTPLLFHLFGQSQWIADMHFMLQKEVVDRLCAVPGSPNYGRLSVMAGYHCRCEPVFDVPPESFFPRPKVMSSVVRLTPHPCPPVAVDPSRLRRVVSAAFSQRRKTLRNALRQFVNESDLAALGIDPGQRAQNLDLQAFARIAEFAAVALPGRPAEPLD